MRDARPMRHSSSRIASAGNAATALSMAARTAVSRPRCRAAAQLLVRSARATGHRRADARRAAPDGRGRPCTPSRATGRSRVPLYQDGQRRLADLGLDFDLGLMWLAVLAVGAGRRPAGGHRGARGARDLRADRVAAVPRPARPARGDRAAAGRPRAGRAGRLRTHRRRARVRSNVRCVTRATDPTPLRVVCPPRSRSPACASSTARRSSPDPTARWCWPTSARTSSRSSRRRGTGPVAGGRRGSARGRTEPPRTTSPSIAASARSGWTCGRRWARACCAGCSSGPTSFVENFRPGGLDRLGFGDDELARHQSAPDPCRDLGLRARRARRREARLRLRRAGGRRADVGHRRLRCGRRRADQGRRRDLATSRRGSSWRSGSSARSSAADGRARAGAAAGPASGVRVDVSLLGSTLALLINQAQNAFVTGQQPSRRGNAHPNIVPYEAFDTADRPIVVAVGSERQWPRFCEAIGLPGLACDPRFATNADRVANREALRPLLAARLRERTRRGLAGGPRCGRRPLRPRQRHPAGVRARSTRRAHGLRRRPSGAGRPFARSARRSSSTARRRPPSQPPPLLGEHTDEILRELGYEETERAAFRRP